MELTLQIDQIDADKITVDEFRKKYLNRGIPVILKEFSKLYPAGEKWTFDYLREKIGDFKIGIFDNTIKKKSAYIKPDFYMPFQEYLDIIRKDEETPYRIFLFNLFKEFPELKKEFPTPQIIKGLLGDIGFAFFGGKNTKVRFHFDIDCSSVLMTQLIGRKRVILISPEYDKLIYKVPYTSFALIDPENPDYEKYPTLKYVKGYDFILSPGDALLMPSRYWHFNTYLEGGMAVSFRAIANTPANIYQGLLNVTLRLLLDKTMNSVLKNNWFEMKREKAISNALSKLKELELTK